MTALFKIAVTRDQVSVWSHLDTKMLNDVINDPVEQGDTLDINRVDTGVTGIIQHNGGRLYWEHRFFLPS